MISTSPILLAVDTSSRWIGLAIYDGTQVIYEAIWSPVVSTGNEFGRAVNPPRHTVELAPAIAEALERCGLKPENLGALAAALGPGSFTGLRIGLALVKGLALARSLPVIGIPTLDALAYAFPAPIARGEWAASSPVPNSAASESLATTESEGTAEKTLERQTPCAARGERHDGSPHVLAAVLRAGRGRLAVGWYHTAETLAATTAGAATTDGAIHHAHRQPRGKPEELLAGWQAAAPIEILTAETLAAKIQQPTLVCGELTAEERSYLLRKQPLAQVATPAQSLRRPGFLAELAWQRWKAGQIDDPASLSPIYLHRP